VSYRITVPVEFGSDPPGWVSPTGESEAARYTKAYKAFWWNCLRVKSQNLQARCPLTCSGTPGATYGCSAGACAAEARLQSLLSRATPTEVQSYLAKAAFTPEVERDMGGYFPDGPQEERVPGDGVEQGDEPDGGL
jgi:hypothetical protein